jgi:hypothetical protein
VFLLLLEERFLSAHLADLLSAHRRCSDRFATENALAQIQFWKIISRLKVAIDVPTDAAEIGVEIEFVLRRHSDQQREMGRNEYNNGDSSAPHRRTIGNRK